MRSSHGAIRAAASCCSPLPLLLPGPRARGRTRRRLHGRAPPELCPAFSPPRPAGIEHVRLQAAPQRHWPLAPASSQLPALAALLLEPLLAPYSSPAAEAAAARCLSARPAAPPRRAPLPLLGTVTPRSTSCASRRAVAKLASVLLRQRPPRARLPARLPASSTRHRPPRAARCSRNFPQGDWCLALTCPLSRSRAKSSAAVHLSSVSVSVWLRQGRQGRSVNRVTDTKSDIDSEGREHRVDHANFTHRQDCHRPPKTDNYLDFDPYLVDETFSELFCYLDPCTTTSPCSSVSVLRWPPSCAP